MDRNEKIEINLDAEDLDPELLLFGGDRVHINIPVPEAPVFNNLDEYYRKSVHKRNESLLNSGPKQNSSSVVKEIENKRLLNSIRNEKVIKSTPKNISKLTDVIQKMSNEHGPLSILYRSLNSSIKVLVRRMKASNLREERFSWITGHLMAFDKHFNLILMNVIESYRHQMREKKNHEIYLIKKSTKQLLIRGDNIILINLIDENRLN
ncbi:hypothetical protein NH340_JMT03150 [Sarcoptes scabiei]|nr:hypothetical protein NH340_JMT03150 [Sarcoptes scabiei]